MKKRKFCSLALLSLMILSGCNQNNDSSSPVLDNTDTKIVEVFEAYKANGGTLDYDAWLASIKGEKWR